MKIKVIGFDPSLNNWGCAKAELDLDTGYLDTPSFTLVHPPKTQGKSVRQNSIDLETSENLFKQIYPLCTNVHVAFVELPVGSQNSRGQTSYGVCVGITGAMKALGVPIIEVTAREVKQALSNNVSASKKEMIEAAYAQFPEASWLKTRKGSLLASNEHLADAIGAIYAGARTPAFQSLMQILLR